MHTISVHHWMTNIYCFSVLCITLLSLLLLFLFYILFSLFIFSWLSSSYLLCLLRLKFHFTCLSVNTFFPFYSFFFFFIKISWVLELAHTNKNVSFGFHCIYIIFYFALSQWASHIDVLQQSIQYDSLQCAILSVCVVFLDSIFFLFFFALYGILNSSRLN